MDTIEVAGRRYGLATRLERLLAQFLDALIYSAILLVPGWTLGTGGTLLGVVAAVLYLLFQDGLARGQSYGKRVTSTAVIDERTGEWCSFGQSFVRNLLLSVLNFIDWIFIFGGKRQRLGDKLASTVVVKL